MKKILENWKNFTNEDKLYHGTSDKYLEKILASGINDPSYWGTYEISEYYSGAVVDDEGGRKIIIEIPLVNFDASKLIPDYNSVEEPLTYTLSQTEEEIWEEWNTSEQTWQDSLEILGSVRYMNRMRVKKNNINYIG